MPASASASIAVSLYESPAAITWNAIDRSARTEARFWSGMRSRYPVTTPPASVTSRWQKSVGIPSCAMSGIANS